MNWLASPVTGGGIRVGRMEQLFLLARDLGHAGSDAWARHAAQMLQAQGQRIVQDGQPVESDERQMEVLLAQAREFEAVRLPVLQGLGMLP